MILIDSGAFYALIDKNDRNHAGAKKFYGTVIGGKTLYTSLPVLTETWLLTNARFGIYFANRLWLSVSKGIFEILDLDRKDLKSAFDIENKYPKAGFSFVDSTCFALCEKHKIHKIFTYDRKHFGIYKPTFSNYLELLPQQNT